MCWYFPIREQLRPLLKLPAYRELLKYESQRVHNDDFMSDVYDSPRWKEVMGAPTNNLSRIALQCCVDGIPAFNRKQSGSVKPVQHIILSLPPWLRYQAKHMLVSMLIPSSLKGNQAKKYYDWAARYEMNDLYRRGVLGVRVVLYGVTLDTPGRRELLNMQAVTAFYPCPHCLHTWQPGIRTQVYGGYRRFLDLHSPWRQREFIFNNQHYMFRDVEERPPPIIRTDQNVSVMVSLARPRKPFCGHKGAAFLNNWVGVDWEGSMCDIMHDLKCMCEMIMKGLVGHGQHGVYKNWDKKKDDKHRDDCEAYGIFEGFYKGIDLLPPWRLSKADVQRLDLRVRSMWWPHYMDKLCKDNHSFWTHSDRMWKCVHKYYVLMVILPTCLHGFVTTVHTAILMFVYALRRLDGQTFSASEARSRGVLPGARVIDKSSISMMGEELIRGLVLLEGSFPVAHLNPAMHHLVHYAFQTARMGVSRWFAMYAFERNNKRVKGLVRNTSQPLASLANSLQMDIATRLISFTEQPDSEFEERTPTCVLYLRNGLWTILSVREKFDLGMLGVTSFVSVRAFKIARILGVHFRSGEWGRRRCGSVVTTLHGGQSRYCVVDKFLCVQGKSFARVVWLSKPKYPYSPNRLVVRVRMLSRRQQLTHSCVIPVDKVEPCSVTVLPDIDDVHFFMLRDKGYDRTTTRPR